MYDTDFMNWLKTVFEESIESSLYKNNGGDYGLPWFLESKVMARARKEKIQPRLQNHEIVLIAKLVEKFGVEGGLQAVREAKSAAGLNSKLKTGPKKAASQVSIGATVDTGGAVGKIRNYTVVSAFDAERLIALVRRELQNGYEPIGGVSVTVRHDPRVEVLFSQAMILRQ